MKSSTFRHVLAVLSISIALTTGLMSLFSPLRGLYVELGTRFEAKQQADVALMVYSEITDSSVNMEEKLKLLEEAAGQYPNNPDIAAKLFEARVQQEFGGAYMNFGNVYTQQKHMDIGPLIAEGYRLAYALESDVAIADVLTNLVLLLYFDPAKPHSSEIEQLVGRVNELNPNQTQAWLYLGRYKKRAEDQNGAIEAFTRATDINPELVNAHLQLAWIYEANNDSSKALEHFKIANRTCKMSKTLYISSDCRYVKKGIERVQQEGS